MIPTLLIPSQLLYLLLNSGPCATATPTPALGSITTFNRSQTRFVASKMSSSDTVIISSTKSLITGQVFGPRFVLRPSATVSILVPGLLVKSFPSVNDRFASSICSGSAKMIFTLSPSIPRRLMQLPDARPPPPTGIITASRFPFPFSNPRTCATNSRQTVPCPAITFGFSLGWIKAAPVDEIILSASAFRASLVFSTTMIFAPKS
mmetsp:Transcript_15788/g.32383  ORF Transcript_15788/g.32383 Transcript_15788/m.32383 type:complete len:206 (+) Transcript_15788:284-901(+)